MKKIFLILSAVFLIGCSADEPVTDGGGSLNIPEEYWGDFTGNQTDIEAKVRKGYVKILDMDISQGYDETYEDGYYYVRFDGGKKLILHQGNGYTGITVLKPNGYHIVSDYFSKQ